MSLFGIGTRYYRPFRKTYRSQKRKSLLKKEPNFHRKRLKLFSGQVVKFVMRLNKRFA